MKPKDPKNNIQIQASPTNRVVIKETFTGGGGGGGPASCKRSLKRRSMRSREEKKRG